MDELKLKAIEEVRKLVVPQPPPDGFTAREYADSIGINIETARKQLGNLVKRGVLDAIPIGNKIFFVLKGRS